MTPQASRAAPQAKATSALAGLAKTFAPVTSTFAARSFATNTVGDAEANAYQASQTITTNACKTTGIDAFGITDVKKVYKNLTFAELFEHEKANKEGAVAKAEYGETFTVDTGKFTGRSPSDKWIVKNVGSESDENLWWGSVNQPTTPEVFEDLFDTAVSHMNSKEQLYVFDGFCGANKSSQKKVRFVHEMAWQQVSFEQEQEAQRSVLDWQLLPPTMSLDTPLRRHRSPLPPSSSPSPCKNFVFAAYCALLSLFARFLPHPPFFRYVLFLNRSSVRTKFVLTCAARFAAIFSACVGPSNTTTSFFFLLPSNIFGAACLSVYAGPLEVERDEDPAVVLRPVEEERAAPSVPVSVVSCEKLLPGVSPPWPTTLVCSMMPLSSVVLPVVVRTSRVEGVFVSRCRDAGVISTTEWRWQ